MKLCIVAVIGCFFFALKGAQSHCDVYFVDDDTVIKVLKKTSAEPVSVNLPFRISKIEMDKANGKLLYTDYGGDIGTIDLDGTGQVQLPYDRDECVVRRAALDTKNGRVLASGGCGDQVGSLLLGPSDGSSPLEVQTGFHAGGDVDSIVYDAETEKAYIATHMDDSQKSYIMAVDVPKGGIVPGAVADVLYEIDQVHIRAIDIDNSNGYIYWTTYSHGVFRAPIDGSGPQEKLYSKYTCSGCDFKIDVVNQVLYMKTTRSISLARADGRGTPQVLYRSSHRHDNDLALDCDGSIDGLPLLAQCSTDDDCFLNGVCTSRVDKPKKCRMCARKNQVCESDGDCCQTASGRYCHRAKKVCKRRRHQSLEFVQCPAGTAFSSISATGKEMSVGSNFNSRWQYIPDYVDPPSTETIDLPFDFPWFGKIVNRTDVTYAGTLNMVPGGGVDTNLIWPDGSGIPRISAIGNRVWNTGPIYLQQSPTSVTISWENAYFAACLQSCWTYAPAQAQVTLFDDGRVVLCWGSVSGGDGGRYSGSLYAGIEDETLGFVKPAVIYPDNPFDEAGYAGRAVLGEVSGQCACFG